VADGIVPFAARQPEPLAAAHGFFPNQPFLRKKMSAKEH
jgi:hypothetical protein